MNTTNISLDSLREKKVAILGYGNQGRAHALNLRDSGMTVVIGAREGAGLEKAREDGFDVQDIESATSLCEVVMFLFPDQVIPQIYGRVSGLLKGKTVGFAHGFAMHFGFIEPLPEVSYFIAAPKGAGAALRTSYETGEGLPGLFAIGPNEVSPTRGICLAYCRALGIAGRRLIETSFKEETECDLFGEQAVLCGGIPQLMEAAFDALVARGFSKEMAFMECCYEARMILQMWMRFGPKTLSEKISPTAFYGGLTRGARLVTPQLKEEMERILDEIQSGEFARDWMDEVQKGQLALHKERSRLDKSPLESVYRSLSPDL